MDEQEWEILVLRVNGLWPPTMTIDSVQAYYDLLKPYTVDQVRTAIDALARTTRERGRPRVGAIIDVIESREASERQAVKRYEEPDKDLLDATGHRLALLHIGKPQTPEHKRRVAAVLALPKRLTCAELESLLPETRCTAEEFDKRLAIIRVRMGAMEEAST